MHVLDGFCPPVTLGIGFASAGVLTAPRRQANFTKNQMARITVRPYIRVVLVMPY